MRPMLYYTAVQVKNLNKDISFFTDILGMEKVGPNTDEILPEQMEKLERNVMPVLFGFDGAEKCRFRSQFVAPKGDHGTFYNIFEWVDPQWVETDRYEPLNHCGLVRSQMQVEGYDDLKDKIKKTDLADFICPEVRWAGNCNIGEQIVFSRAGSIRHNSGAMFQIKQSEDDELSARTARALRVNHRAIHTKDVVRSIDFYCDTLGLEVNFGIGSKDRHTHMLTSVQKYGFSPTYVHYLTEYQLQTFFGFSFEETPQCDHDTANYLLADTIGRKSTQNLDLFQWIEPKVFGDPYPVANHIGLQRICFIVENFDEVKEKMKYQAKKIICEEVKLPDMLLPGLSEPVGRAMSVLDPDGVFVLVYGK